MFKPVNYLIGSAGPNGFGSKSMGQEVTAACSDLKLHHHHHPIIHSTNSLAKQKRSIIITNTEPYESTSKLYTAINKS